MSNRHIGRTLALQTLFELDMRDSLSLSKDEVSAIVLRDRDEFAEGYNDTNFVIDLVVDVEKRLITLDDIIVRAAPDWPLAKINTIDRNILRLGLCELLFGDRGQVPPKVAIDEAIELAKTFGGETSGKFINGVLGAIYKEMGEPEKAQTSKKRADENAKEYLTGAVVFNKGPQGISFALVHDVFGYWTLTKGKLQGEEALDAACLRNIEEEIGLKGTIIEKLDENEYIANKPDIGKVIKHVTYFLVESPHTEIILEKKGGLDDAKWFKEEEIAHLHMYDDIKKRLHVALQKLTTQ